MCAVAKPQIHACRFLLKRFLILQKAFSFVDSIWSYKSGF
ncbi:Hypothetical protein BN2458_PEG0875 [Helicobacter typhlonius]|uniref:Uncharacterized protein n=1 Tax=Helicobacter typhlonius TaxID=76936 RepID=A0A0S4PWP2_9HELI|nr:Hypothetical protein BN2458_PEG0875 [Helicobacter typhlonius]